MKEKKKRIIEEEIRLKNLYAHTDPYIAADHPHDVWIILLLRLNGPEDCARSNKRESVFWPQYLR